MRVIIIVWGLFSMLFPSTRDYELLIYYEKMSRDTDKFKHYTGLVLYALKYGKIQALNLLAKVVLWLIQAAFIGLIIYLIYLFAQPRR